ncbi:MAG: YraN family protein [Candidatus Omnitrophota bacterium]
MNKTGLIGERIALSYLKRLGYKIIERNFRLKCGEIDIIARDGECMCFIEVRARASNSFAEPFETVDYIKQKKLTQAAKIWVSKHKCEDDICRFDIVSILLDENYKMTQMRLFKDAFWDDEG